MTLQQTVINSKIFIVSRSFCYVEFTKNDQQCNFTLELLYITTALKMNAKYKLLSTSKKLLSLWNSSSNFTVVKNVERLIYHSFAALNLIELPKKEDVVSQAKTIFQHYVYIRLKVSIQRFIYK